MRAIAGSLVFGLATAPLACGTGEVTPVSGQEARLDGGLGTGDPDGGAPAANDGGGGGDPADAGGGMWEAELVYCIDETNRYRALADLPPLARSAALEAYAADGAELDHESGEPHKHFLDTNGGNGLASAENEIPRWPVSMFGSVHNVIREGIEMMMDEGEGGPHHDAILGPYERLGCGVYRSGDLVTVVQDFGG